MSNDISKICSDFLRAHHNGSLSEKLKASHARELVAAFFGYKSHAALIAESDFPLARIEETAILAPDMPLVEKRRAKLNGLPPDLLSSRDLADALCKHLQAESLFHGEVWLHDRLDYFVIENYLPDQDYQVMDQLSGVMAETNALFDEAYYEEAVVAHGPEELTITVTG